jgi:hypothetical protein
VPGDQCKSFDPLDEKSASEWKEMANYFLFSCKNPGNSSADEDSNYRKKNSMP